MTIFYFLSLLILLRTFCYFSTSLLWILKKKRQNKKSLTALPITFALYYKLFHNFLFVLSFYLLIRTFLPVPHLAAYPCWIDSDMCDI